MSLQSEQDLLKTLVLKAFNKQFTTTFGNNDVTFLYQPPGEGDVGRILAITNVVNDHVRMLVRVVSFGTYSDVNRFELILLPNYPAGNQRDEVYATKMVLRSSDFPELRRYMNTEEYRGSTGRPTHAATQDGHTVVTQSGLPISVQRF